MLEEEYKRAFEHIAPSRQLVERTQRSVEAMINGKKVKKITLRAALVMAIVLIVLATVAFAAVKSVLLLGRSDEIVQQMQPLVQTMDNRYEGSYVDIEAQEALLTDEALALAWTVTNKTTKRLYVGAPTAFKMNDGYLSGGGSSENDFDYYLDPGQSVDCQINRRILPGDPLEMEDSGPCQPLAPTGNRCHIGLSVYEVPESWGDSTDSPEDEDLLAPFETSFGDTYPAAEGRWALVEAAGLTITLDKTSLPILSAQPQSFDFQDYTLQIDRAEITATSARFAWQVIFDSYEDAMARPCAGESDFWYYTIEPADGLDEYWAGNGGGSPTPHPVELPDGRWAWQGEWDYVDLYRLPAAFTLTPVHYRDDHLEVIKDEAVTIHLS